MVRKKSNKTTTGRAAKAAEPVEKAAPEVGRPAGADAPDATKTENPDAVTLEADTPPEPAPVTAQVPGQMPPPPQRNLENDKADNRPASARGPVPVRRVGRRRAAGPSRGTAAANDDVPSIGGLIYALQQKPSRRPFTVAAVMSAVWGLLGLILAWLALGSDLVEAVPFSQLIARPQTVLLAVAVLLPIAMFWFLAVLVWRAQELRLMSSAMTEVAFRLAEPDKLAEQSVASLGQTVRRQVMSMNDAINRSLGRAGELEALVHSEVAALERAYHDNEIRVRGLINELVSERESLTNNSNRVSDTIRGIGLEVTKEIASASEVAAKSLSAATVTLSTEVQKSGSQLTARIQATNDQTAHLMSESGNSLLASLSDMNKRIGVEVPALLDKLAGEQTRLTRVVEGAGRNLAALETALGERVESLDMSLGEKTELLRDALQNKIKDFDDTFTDKARALDAAIGEKMGQFDHAITERTRMIEAAMQHQAGQVDGAIAKGIDAVQRSSENITTQSLRTLDGLTRQGESLRDVSEGLLGQIRDLTERFDHQGQAIMKAAHALESSNFRMDSVLEHRHSELSGLLDEISTRAEVFDDAMRTYSGSGDGAMPPATGSGGGGLRQRFIRASQEVSREMNDLSGRVSQSSSGGGYPSEIDQRRAQLQRELDELPRNGGGKTAAARRAMEEKLMSLDALSEASTGAMSYPPAVRHDQAPASRQGHAPAGGERWSLGDLLSRASDDMPLPMVNEGAASAGRGNTGTVTLDLKNMARAIDMATATDIWSRLNAGERNLLDREIYTIDGRVTFDEIGRRYVADMAFRNTVNRYLGDFEQLLREVDAKDPGGNIVRSHLVSEMGRVYLLLAHASGRLA